MHILHTLVTDRTAQDVSLWRSLRAKGLAGMTAAQRALWLAGMRGSYTVADGNRVGEAVAYVTQRLAARGIVAHTNPKTDWALGSIPTQTALASYAADIAAIRAALTVSGATPPAPGDVNSLTWQEANDIEQILIDVDALLTLMGRSVDLGWALGASHTGLCAASRAPLLLTPDDTVLLQESGDYLDQNLSLLLEAGRVGQGALLLVSGAQQSYKTEVNLWRQ